MKRLVLATAAVVALAFAAMPVDAKSSSPTFTAEQKEKAWNNLGRITTAFLECDGAVTMTQRNIAAFGVVSQALGGVDANNDAFTDGALEFRMNSLPLKARCALIAAEFPQFLTAK